MSPTTMFLLCRFIFLFFRRHKEDVITKFFMPNKQGVPNAPRKCPACHRNVFDSEEAVNHGKVCLGLLGNQESSSTCCKPWKRNCQFIQSSGNNNMPTPVHQPGCAVFTFVKDWDLNCFLKVRKKQKKNKTERDLFKKLLPQGKEKAKEK